MMINGKKARGVLGILIGAIVLCIGCGSTDDDNVNQFANIEEVTDTQTTIVQMTDTQTDNAQSGEDLDTVEPSADDEKWYMAGDVYTDDTGRRVEVLFDDYGMLEFAVDGLSLYYTNADNFQQENNWKIYTCDDGTIIVYYPGTPALIEICDGTYAGIYRAGNDEVK